MQENFFPGRHGIFLKRRLTKYFTKITTQWDSERIYFFNNSKFEKTNTIINSQNHKKNNNETCKIDKKNNQYNKLKEKSTKKINVAVSNNYKLLANQT